MEELLKQILSELKELKISQEGLRTSQEELRVNQTETNQRLSRLEQTVDKKVSDTRAQVSAIKDAVIKGEEAYDFVQGIKNMMSSKG